MHTLHLTERRPTLARLSRRDAAFLAELPGTPIALLPASSGKYRLTPRGVAGVICTPTIRVVIQPKIPLRNLFFFLDSPLPQTGEDTTSLSPEILPLLVHLLCDQLEEQARSGLRREYVEQRQERGYLSGRLEMAEMMRQNPAQRDRFPVVEEDFTTDHLRNRLAKATAEMLLPLLPEPLRTRLRTVLVAWQGIESVPLSVVAFEQVPLQRLNEVERRLLDLCRVLALGCSPDTHSGDFRFPTFLLEMESLFEQWLTREIRATSKQEVSAQESSPLFTDATLGRIRPDIILRQRGKIVRILDAKWKSPGPDPADVYQMLTYATVLGCNDVRLVYPGSRNSSRSLTIAGTAIRLTLHRVKVTGTAEEARQGTLRLS